MNKASLIETILAELKVIFHENNLEEKDLNEETILFGAGSAIDSLDLVGLIVKIEEHVLEKTNREIQIINEEAVISGGSTPFKTVASLAQLVMQKIDEK